MQPTAVLSYTIIISMILYLINRNNIKELILGRKQFSCRRCGHCCRLLVRLYDNDIKRLEDAGYKQSEFAVMIKKKPYIKQKNRYCPWLEIKSGTARCTIYENRPKICREFPQKRIFRMPGYDCRCCSFNKKF
jgi:Fe-S-cluster containining protein